VIFISSSWLAAQQAPDPSSSVALGRLVLADGVHDPERAFVLRVEAKRGFRGLARADAQAQPGEDLGELGVVPGMPGRELDRLFQRLNPLAHPVRVAGEGAAEAGVIPRLLGGVGGGDAQQLDGVEEILRSEELLGAIVGVARDLLAFRLLSYSARARSLDRVLNAAVISWKLCCAACFAAGSGNRSGCRSRASFAYALRTSAMAADGAMPSNS
jgi:hypothetical protein